VQRHPPRRVDDVLNDVVPAGEDQLADVTPQGVAHIGPCRRAPEGRTVARQDSAYGLLLCQGEPRQHVGGSRDLLRDGALKVEDGRTLIRERRFGRLDGGERSVYLREDRPGGAGRHGGFPRLTPRCLDLAQPIQGVLQEQCASGEGAQPLVRLKLSLLPELLLELDHVEGRMAAQDRLGVGQLEIDPRARLAQLSADRLTLGSLGQLPGQAAEQLGHLRGAGRDLHHRNRVRGRSQ
jgi:hypothetical protein